MSSSRPQHRPQAMRKGTRGLDVVDLRGQLARLGFDVPVAPDLDAFDAACDTAVRAFQQQRGLRVDGIVGRETARELEEARWHLGDRVLAYSVRHTLVGDDIAELQQRLSAMGFDCGRVDGIFGPMTDAAVREFQRNVGLPAHGTCGPATFRALRQLRRTVVGGRATELREFERLHHAGPTLAGKLVVVDPGHGGIDRGVSVGGIDEAFVVDDIAGRVEGRLSAAGAQAFRTRSAEPRGESAPPTDADRAAFANAAEADLLLSLHVDGAPDPACQGTATYYFGTARTGERSLVGARLAALVQEELSARTDLLDCRTHPVTWELLRRTRMPAVRVDVGYLTNPGDAVRLASEHFRDELAEALVVAIQRLYLPMMLDAPMGDTADAADAVGAASAAGFTRV